jgi:hypothetical protein
MKYETTPHKVRDSYKKSSDNNTELPKKETDKKTVKYKDKNINGTIVTLYDSGYSQIAATAINGVIDTFTDIRQSRYGTITEINTLLDYYQGWTEFVDF